MHKTKGIVLRSVSYGETSIITTVYTELFGVQSYIVKGVRQAARRSQLKTSYFQPSAILEMEVHHNEQKNLQFIKEYGWSYLYRRVLSDVVRNAIAMYMIELLQHSLKQPEANPELFYLAESSLLQLDTGSDAGIANLPVYFTLHLGSELGFRIQGFYSEETPVLDLQQGFFIGHTPTHPYYLETEMASVMSRINSVHSYEELEAIKLNRNMRRGLLQASQQYIGWHVQDFGEMRSISILQEILG